MFSFSFSFFRFNFFLTPSDEQTSDFYADNFLVHLSGARHFFLQTFHKSCLFHYSARLYIVEMSRTQSAGDELSKKSRKAWSGHVSSFRKFVSRKAAKGGTIEEYNFTFSYCGAECLR